MRVPRSGPVLAKVDLQRKGTPNYPAARRSPHHNTVPAPVTARRSEFDRDRELLPIFYLCCNCCLPPPAPPLPSLTAAPDPRSSTQQPERRTTPWPSPPLPLALPTYVSMLPNLAVLLLTCVAAAQPAVCTPASGHARRSSLTWDRHKIVAKRGAAFTIMVCYVKLRDPTGWPLITTGCWRVGPRKDDLHQHPFLHHHQELCRPQAPAHEADGQDCRD